MARHGQLIGKVPSNSFARLIFGLGQSVISFEIDCCGTRNNTGPLNPLTSARPQPAPHTFMSPKSRRVLQAVVYEIIAVAFVGPVLSLAFNQPASSTTALAVVLSSVALAWNYVFNHLFERWESRQAVKGRSLARRLAHGMGFEGGLTVLLIPVMSFWLKIPALEAFVANLGLLAFFFVYAIAFTWVFDRVFGLPQSATGMP